MKNTETTRLFFKSRWILAYLYHSNRHNFGYILRNVTNLHFRKPTEFYQNTPTFISIAPPITKEQPFKKNEKWVFFGGSFFKMKYFLINQIFGQKFIIIGKTSYRDQLLFQLRVVEEHRLDQLNSKHTKITVKLTMQFPLTKWARHLVL